MVECIDVSSWQGNIDWGKVAAAGVKRVMVRVGYWTTFDAKFARNVECAQRAGLDVGVYLYTYSTSPTDAIKEAEFVLGAISKYKLTMPVAYDMEYEPKILAMSNAQRTEICKAFLRKIESAGYYAVLYGSADFVRNRLNWRELERWDKWIASYTSNPPTMPCEYGMWQYSSEGRIPGINGNVDCNVCYKDYPAIIRNMRKEAEKVEGKSKLYTITIGPMSKGDYATVKSVVADVTGRLGNIKVETAETEVQK